MEIIKTFIRAHLRQIVSAVVCILVATVGYMGVTINNQTKRLALIESAVSGLLSGQLPSVQMPDGKFQPAWQLVAENLTDLHKLLPPSTAKVASPSSPFTLTP